MPDAADAGRRALWRSLEERSGATPDPAEFPPGADLAPREMSRRDFVRLVGAAAALAGAAACGQPVEKILPYVRQPQGVTPGVPQHYATSMLLGGYATGLLVESHEGRPTKIEGNPDHPASLGAAGVFEQASVLGLYDPARAKRVLRRGAPSSWSALAGEVARVRPPGAGLRFLLEPTSSPLVGDVVAKLRAAYPAARFTFHAPLGGASALEGARLAAGRPLVPQYDFRAAACVLALDADFLAAMPFHLRYGRHFAERRRVGRQADMSRLYAVESTLTVTGAAADERLRARPDEIGEVLGAVGAALAAVPSLAGRVPADVASALAPFRASRHAAWARAVAADLAAHPGESIVLVGDGQPPQLHALAHALNAALGNLGRTTWFTASPLVDAAAAGAAQPLEELVAEMRAGRIETLVVLGGNPVYTAPADLEFGEALRRVPRSVYLGLHPDETARAATWLVPAAHYLEAWGDGRAYDGTASLVQPLIAPMYGGRTEAELLALFLGQPAASAHALLRESWRARLPSDAAWEEALRRGVVEGSAFPRETPAIAFASAGGKQKFQHRGHEEDGEPPSVFSVLSVLKSSLPSRADPPLVVQFRPDPSVYDGRFAGNAWLQELPDPITKLTWGNAALLSPATATRLGVSSGELLRLRLRGRRVDAPAFVLPGHADDAVTLHLGYGRRSADGAGGGSRTGDTDAGAVGDGVGFDAYALRTSAAPDFDTGLTIERLGTRVRLATTQGHWGMNGRPVALAATLEEFRADPDLTRRERGRQLSLYRPYRYTEGNQWAMVIDLSACTGCNACVVACQAENNVPVVGMEGVLDSREMHWLRIDRYFSGDEADPDVVVQPMLCQHCEQAPCEYVCPVGATVHGPEGLNEMIYNRCVGTRFCSNNCPYKVRRFNWFDYSGRASETEEMQRNPEVTVRGRGVMEKCTFCVQRIRRAEITAQVEGRPLRTGEVVTACQQACPTRAIVFGSYTDSGDAELAARLADPRRYEVLHDLGTEPRVKYLARISNPNPALERAEVAAAEPPPPAVTAPEVAADASAEAGIDAPLISGDPARPETAG